MWLASLRPVRRCVPRFSEARISDTYRPPSRAERWSVLPSTRWLGAAAQAIRSSGLGASRSTSNRLGPGSATPATPGLATPGLATPGSSPGEWDRMLGVASLAEAGLVGWRGWASRRGIEGFRPSAFRATRSTQRTPASARLYRNTPFSRLPPVNGFEFLFRVLPRVLRAQKSASLFGLALLLKGEREGLR